MTNFFWFLVGLGLSAWPMVLIVYALCVQLFNHTSVRPDTTVLILAMTSIVVGNVLMTRFLKSNRDENE